MRNYLSLIGRIFLSLIFIYHGIMKAIDFETFWHVLNLKGVPAAPLVSIIVVFIELGGGVAILIGFYTRFFTSIMAIYLIGVTIFNYPFWFDMDLLEDFMKNFAIIGGLIIEDYAGAGKNSVDDSHVFDV